LDGFHGLTLAQAFYDFATSNTIAIGSTINASITTLIETAPGVGVPAQAGPPPTVQNLSLTVSQDTIATGATFDGQTVGGSNTNTVVTGNLDGIFGNQPTLTPGDSIVLTTGDNTLVASFDGSDTVGALTIQGVQTWDIQNLASTSGHTVTLTGPVGGIADLNALTYQDNGFGNSLVVGGAPPAGIDDSAGGASGFDLTVEDAKGNGNSGGDHRVDLLFTAASFTGGDTINVTANLVGNIDPGNTSLSISHAYNIAAGNPNAGFAVWNVTSEGALANGSVNAIALGGEGSTSATTLNITDDGSTTVIWASAASGSDKAADWADLTTVDASGTTGELWVTGGENGSNGILGDAGGITEVLGGTGADLFDLTALGGSVGDVTINGGGNTTGTNALGDTGTGIELNNSEINDISLDNASNAFEEWAGVNILYNVGDDTGGAVNMADFPGTNIVTVLNSSSGTTGITQVYDFNVTNAMDGFTFNFNETDQQGFAFSVIGTDTTGGASNVVNINYTSVSATGTFTSQNFDTVNVTVNDVNSTQDFYTGAGVPFGSPDILVIGNADFGSPVGEGVTLNIAANGDFTGSGTLEIGNISSGAIGDDSITLLSGPITGLPLHPSYLDTGTLDISGNENVIIGVTNADVINSTTSGTFDMTSPDDANTPGTVAEWLLYNGVDVTASSAGSTLQGTLGSAGNFKGFPILDAGNDSLTDTAGGVSFYGDGGSDSISLGSGSFDANTVYFGEFLLNDLPGRQPIENNGVAADGFWDAGPSLVGTTITGSTSGDLTTVTGFSVGNDNLVFNVNAWSGGNTHGDLDDAAAVTRISDTSASGSTVFLGTSNETLSSTPGTTTATGHVDLILDGINNQSFANASELASSIGTTGIGNFNLGHTLANNGIIDLLVAYFNGSNVVIADVELQNHSGSATANTGSMTVFASDMVSLVGVTSLASLGTTANALHIEFAHL
jgi:hypothetical protein